MEHNIIDNDIDDKQQIHNQSINQTNNQSINQIDHKCNNECCCNKQSVIELSNIYINQSIAIIIQKECGYEFLLYLNQYSKLIDLYRYVEQFYHHCNDNKLIYVDNQRIELISRSEESLKDFINKNRIRPIISPIEYKSSYKFYLSFI
jgi:transcription elongation factor Elf1